MPIDTARALRAQSASAYTLYAMAALAGGASILTAATYGSERAGPLGAAVGIGCALGCLLGPRLLMQAVKARDWARTVATTVLLAIAVPFAVSGALGAAAASRDTAQRSDGKLTADRERLTAEHRRATTALERLQPTRPTTAIQHELATVLANPTLAGCQGWLPSSAARNICIRQVEPARVELSIAEQRARLEVDARRASEALLALNVGRPASADSEALSRLAGRIGITVAPESVTDGLLVLTVLAVELLGGLALALAVPVTTVVSPSSAPVPTMPVAAPAASGSAAGFDRNADVIRRLQAGPLVGAQKSIAARLGMPVTSLRNAVASDPRLRLTASREGSRLELVTH